jgi:hypothetical protein
VTHPFDDENKIISTADNRDEHCRGDAVTDDIDEKTGDV